MLIRQKRGYGRHKVIGNLENGTFLLDSWRKSFGSSDRTGDTVLQCKQNSDKRRYNAAHETD